MNELSTLYTNFEANLPEHIQYAHCMFYTDGRPAHLIVKYKKGGVTSVCGYDMIVKYLKKQL